MKFVPGDSLSPYIGWVASHMIPNRAKRPSRFLILSSKIYLRGILILIFINNPVRMLSDIAVKFERLLSTLLLLTFENTLRHRGYLRLIWLSRVIGPIGPIRVYFLSVLAIEAAIVLLINPNTFLVRSVIGPHRRNRLVIRQNSILLIIIVVESVETTTIRLFIIRLVYHFKLLDWRLLVHVEMGLRLHDQRHLNLLLL